VESREERRGVARDELEQLPRLQFEQLQLRCGVVGVDLGRFMADDPINPPRVNGVLVHPCR